MLAHRSEREHGVVAREVLTAGSGLAFLQGLIDGAHPPPPFSRTTGIYLTAVSEGTDADRRKPRLAVVICRSRMMVAIPARQRRIRDRAWPGPAESAPSSCRPPSGYCPPQRKRRAQARFLTALSSLSVTRDACRSISASDNPSSPSAPGL